MHMPKETAILMMVVSTCTRKLKVGIHVASNDSVTVVHEIQKRVLIADIIL